MRQIILVASLAAIFAGGCCTYQTAPAPPPGACSDCGTCAPDDFFCQGPAGEVKRQLTCNSGCGELYIDEWLSDPPPCKDPCDLDGNYIGPQTCVPFAWLGDCLHRLWGVRYHSCNRPDCNECGGIPGDVHYQGAYEQFEIESVPPGQPTPATPTAATPIKHRQPRKLHTTSGTRIRR